MRYDDWDVLLFSSNHVERGSFKEFSVNCHVVEDAESPHGRTSFGLPAMTCFVPSLQPGAQFHISIHSWGTPRISQYALTYSKFPSLVTLEARIMIDGRMVASTTFEPVSEWPHLIATTSEMSRQGELQPLRFPPFRRELLYQNHWNPADDLGRIKVIISEGFPRDSPSNPIERIKNVVVFSFQHAPLEILETNGIAWPNPQMWRRPQNDPALPVPTYHPDDGADSHLHSPRRMSNLVRGVGSGTSTTLPAGMSGSFTYHPAAPSVQKNSSSSTLDFLDHFSEAAYQEWFNSLGSSQQTLWPGSAMRDTSKDNDSNGIVADMPTFLSYTMGQNVGSEYLNFSIPDLNDNSLAQSLKVPANTPASLIGGTGAAVGQGGYEMARPPMSSELSNSLTCSLLNQPHPMSGAPKHVLHHQVPLPASEVTSRKENRHLSSTGSMQSPLLASSPSVEAQFKKFPQPINAVAVVGNERDSVGSSYPCQTLAGDLGVPIPDQGTPLQAVTGGAAVASKLEVENKRIPTRSCRFTPARARVIDEEDEPRRSSPRSRASTTKPRPLLSEIQNDE